MNVTQINDSWHASSDAFPGCSGQGPTRQDAAEQLLLAIEEQFRRKESRTRFVRDLVVTRAWEEDCEYVEWWLPHPVPIRSASVKQSEASLPTIIAAWKMQIASEFNEALPDGGETESASIIAFHTGGDADVSLRSDSDMLWYAEFRVTLDFWYDDDLVDVLHADADGFPEDRDIIQHIFYDEGGVCGDFLLFSPGEGGGE